MEKNNPKFKPAFISAILLIWNVRRDGISAINKLPASLKDDTANMNDRNKHKVTGKMNHQTADPIANASVFLFLPTAHFLKTVLTSRINGTFGFASSHEANASAKAKEPFFANAQKNITLIN